MLVLSIAQSLVPFNFLSTLIPLVISSIMALNTIFMPSLPNLYIQSRPLSSRFINSTVYRTFLGYLLGISNSTCPNLNIVSFLLNLLPISVKGNVILASAQAVLLSVILDNIPSFFFSYPTSTTLANPVGVTNLICLEFDYCFQSDHSDSTFHHFSSGLSQSLAN